MNDQAEKLRELARAGVFSAIAMAADTTRGEPQTAPGSRCTSIAVTSGKGGVGKTTIALCLAVALARMRKRTLVFDADLGLANVHIMLGSAPRFNLSHVVRGECALEEAVWKGPAGVDVLPGASGLEEMANLDRSGIARIHGMFGPFERNYDYLLIDTAAGIGASVTGFAAHADIPLLVLSPEPASLADAYAMTKVLYEHGSRRIAAIVNMAASDREGAETFDKLSTLVVKFLKKGIAPYGYLPYEREVPRYIKKQQVPVLRDPNNRFSAKIQSVAWKLSGLSPAGGEGFFTRLWKKVNDFTPG